MDSGLSKSVSFERQSYGHSDRIKQIEIRAATVATAGPVIGAFVPFTAAGSCSGLRLSTSVCPVHDNRLAIDQQLVWQIEWSTLHFFFGRLLAVAVWRWWWLLNQARNKRSLWGLLGFVFTGGGITFRITSCINHSSIFDVKGGSC